MVEHIIKHPNSLVRVVLLDKQELSDQIARLAYKYSKTAIQDQRTGDEIAVDAEDSLDGPILARLMLMRDAAIRKRLAFCLIEDEVVISENVGDHEGKFAYVMALPRTFSRNSVEVGQIYMNDFIVKGALMDWYKEIGVQYGAALQQEVDVLESRIVDIFRTPSVVVRGFVPHTHPYKIR